MQDEETRTSLELFEMGDFLSIIDNKFILLFPIITVSSGITASLDECVAHD